MTPRRARSRTRCHRRCGLLAGLLVLALPAVPVEARTWLLRAEDYLKREQAEPAFSCYRKALDLSPDSPTLLLSYALACLRYDRSREAERTARRLLEQLPLIRSPGNLLRQ